MSTGDAGPRGYSASLELNDQLDAFQATERPVQLQRMQAAALRALALFESVG